MASDWEVKLPRCMLGVTVRGGNWTHRIPEELQTCCSSTGTCLTSWREYGHNYSCYTSTEVWVETSPESRCPAGSEPRRFSQDLGARVQQGHLQQVFPWSKGRASKHGSLPLSRLSKSRHWSFSSNISLTSMGFKPFPRVTVSRHRSPRIDRDVLDYVHG